MSPLPVDQENPHCYSTNLISNKNAHPQGNGKIASRTYAIRQEKNEYFNFGMVEHYVEDGEESAPKLVNDSENASHVGEDILGSELKW